MWRFESLLKSLGNIVLDAEITLLLAADLVFVGVVVDSKHFVDDLVFLFYVCV